MPAMNQPGACQPCCIVEPSCHPEIEGRPCVGTRTNPSTDAVARYSGAGCLKCKPRYRCAVINFEPAAYSTLCPATVSLKLVYACPDQWVGLDQSTTGIGVTVELYRQGDVYDGCRCYYRVALAVGASSVTYEAIELDDLGLTEYEISDENGTYTATIAGANVVANPLATVACSPCYCATCIPGALFVSLLDTHGNFFSHHPPYYLCTNRNGITVNWDCELGAYEPAVFTFAGKGDLTVSIRPKPVSDGICALDVDISANFPGLAGLGIDYIPLEQVNSPNNCGDVTLVDCRAGDGESSVSQGFRGQGGCVGESLTGTLHGEFTVSEEGGSYSDGGLFRVVVDEVMCARQEFSSPACKGQCPTLDYPRFLQCGEKFITLTIIAPGCCYDGVSWTMVGDTPLQDPCQRYGENSGSTPPTTVPVFPFAVTYAPGGDPAEPNVPFGSFGYYSPFSCDGDAPVELAGYRLKIRFAGNCIAGSFGGPGVVIYDLSGGIGTCKPFVLDFTVGRLPLIPACDCTYPCDPTMIIRVTL